MLEITIIPLGTGSTSASRYVADAYRIIKDSGFPFELTPTATVVEGNIGDLFEIAQKVHESPFKRGIKRVVTMIKIDDRRDKNITMEYKKKSVIEKVKEKTS